MQIEMQAELDKLVSALREADAVVVGSPGYHGAVSGLVKNALDYIEDLREDPRVYLDNTPWGCISCAYGWQAAVGTLGQLRSIGHALRAWIPFVDCQEGNRPALARTVLKLGLNIRRSGVRWAAYLALPSKRQTVFFEDVPIPRPPAYSRSDARRADDGASGSSGQGGHLSYDGELSDDALSEIAESLFRALDAEESEHADR